MATENLQEGLEVTPEAFKDLQKTVQKLEKKLAKAKSRAQATMQEIWQLDVKLKEEEERANSAEERLSEFEQGAPSEDQGEELQDLRAQLELAKEETAQLGEYKARIEQLEDQLTEPPDDTELKALQEKVQSLEAELAEAPDGSELSALRDRVQELESEASDQADIQALQDRLSELEQENLQLQSAQVESVEPSDRELVEARLGGLRIALQEAEARAEESQRKLEALSTSGPSVEASTELEELRQELTAAQDRISELEGESGVSLEQHQALEKELEDLQRELEQLRQVQGDPEGGDLESALADYRERLELADERGELLQEKVEQTEEKLAASESELERLRAQNEKLAKDAEESTGEPGLALSGAVAGSQLQDALQRARDAELKANQADVQLQKAMDTLSEYEQRANESDRETQRLAFQDSLTGLPNLNLIKQYLDFTVKQVQKYSRASALLVVDLDRFKLINDAMGMKAGDELLVKVAERLQTAIRESDALGRKGEDEFLILLSELVTGDDAPPEQKTNMIRQNIAIVVNRISECLSRPFVIQGQKFYLRASIGVSICPNDASSDQEMLEHADSAMYHAKESGRGRCVFYNNELHKRQERRLAMDSQLRLAMEKGEFVLQYQPIVEVTKGKASIVGVEALLRWNHRLEGLLAPAAFLTSAEETGLIVQLGQWVCRQACWQLRQWLSQGHNLFVSFNVSTRQMLQADLAEMILNSVEEFGLQPGLVFVELSEGKNSEEVDLIERVVSNLGRAGVRVAIDDFGVGYSSLSRIDLNHIQFLKVDPSLVDGCQQEKAKQNICEAAVNLASSLELRSLAEGVENINQARFLAKCGCQFMQGFFIQKPSDAEVITKLLDEKKTWKF